MTRSLILGIVALSIILPGVDAASSPFGIGPRVGFYKSEDAEDGRGFLGFQARFKFTEVFVGELSIDWRRDTYHLGGGDELIVTQYPVLLSAIFNILPSSPITPYVILGAGWYNINQSYDYGDDNFDDNTQEFGYHLGGGVDFRFKPSMALNADVRYNMLEFEHNNGSDEFDAGGWIFSTGLTFYL